MYQGPSNIYLAFPAMDGGGGGTPLPSGAGGSLQHPPGPPPPPPPPLPPQFSGASPPSAAVMEQLQIQYDQFGVPYHPHPHHQHQHQHHHPPHHHQPYPPLPPLASHHSLGSEGGGGHPGLLTRENSLAYNSECNGAGSATEPSSADSTTPHSPPDLSVYSPSGWTSADQTQLTAQLSDPSGNGGMVSPPPLTAPAAGYGPAPAAAAPPRPQPPPPSRPTFHHRQNFQVGLVQILLNYMLLNSCYISESY